MADPKGFMKIGMKPAGNRPVHERTGDYSEVEQVLNSEDRSSRLHAAWIVASHSVTGAARWTT